MVELLFKTLVGKRIVKRNGCLFSTLIYLFTVELNALFCAANDQHAFTLLWHDNPDVQSHVALLDPATINSYFPAWKYQKSTDPVVHLAGCSSAFRIKAFSTAWANICVAKDEMRLLKPQLGLTRELLADIESSLPVLDELRSVIAAGLPEICDYRSNASQILDVCDTISYTYMYTKNMYISVISLCCYF